MPLHLLLSDGEGDVVSTPERLHIWKQQPRLHIYMNYEERYEVGDVSFQNSNWKIGNLEEAPKDQTQNNI